MISNTVQTVTHSTMAWALYLSNSNQHLVTDAQLAELDDFELACRAGPSTRARLLSERVGYIAHALVCTAGSVNSRSQMLRSVTFLRDVLQDVDHKLLQTAIRGLAMCHIARTKSSRLSSSVFPPHSPARKGSAEPAFLASLVNIAVNRVSDTELSAAAADSLATILGCPSLDAGADDQIPNHICREADDQARKLIAMLITEIVLTGSPRALSSLSKLLRRDATRLAFCEKDGVSTLASTLQTDPKDGYTAIGEIVVRSELDADPISASYHAVFSVWMLTFAVKRTVAEVVLKNVRSSRLVIILAKLLNHASGQRLKIARVTLASLRNMVSGDSSLHSQIARDLISAEVPAVLERLMKLTSGAGSMIGNDDDAASDARELSELLAKENASLSTVDAYIAEIEAGALHWSAIHRDDTFWMTQSQALVEDKRKVLALLADLIQNEKASVEEKVIACHDLALIMRHSETRRRNFLALKDLKRHLMMLMVSDVDADLRASALRCVEVMLIHSL